MAHIFADWIRLTQRHDIPAPWNYRSLTSNKVTDFASSPDASINQTPPVSLSSGSSVSSVGSNGPVALSPLASPVTIRIKDSKVLDRIRSDIGLLIQELHKELGELYPYYGLLEEGPTRTALSRISATGVSFWQASAIRKEYFHLLK